MQERIEIQAQPRKPGKGRSKAYRSQRQIPAVVYGPKMKTNLNLTISQNDAIKYAASRAYENAVFSLKSEDSQINGLDVIVKDISKNSTSHLPLHIDFYAPDMTKTIRVNVELKFTGKPQGVKDGGVFNVIRREIEIECLPSEIPENFEVKVDDLELNQTLHISDLGIGEKYKVITDEKMTVANVTMVEEEASKTEDEASPEGEAATTPAEEKK